jgi:hypothetical protein
MLTWGEDMVIDAKVSRQGWICSDLLIVAADAQILGAT